MKLYHYSRCGGSFLHFHVMVGCCYKLQLYDVINCLTVSVFVGLLLYILIIVVSNICFYKPV